MKLKPKKSSTVVMRVTPATLKAIDAYRAKMGLRTNAQGAQDLVDTHPAIKSPKKTKGGSHV